MDLDSVSTELYGLSPEDFTAARTAREKEAKGAGDRELAAAIHALAKPNLVAWLANQLARQHEVELRALLDLGAGLRDSADALTGEQLREFTRQKRQLVGALVQLGRTAASQAGRKVSLDAARGIEETLNAALADPDAADLLLAGRLSSGLQSSGFGPVVGGGSPGLTSVPAPSQTAAPARGGSREQRLAVRVTAAERELDQARTSAARAARTKTEAEEAVEQAATTCEEAAQKVARLRAKLERATTAQAEADWERRRTRKDLEKVDRLVAQTERRVRDAEQRLAELTAQDD